MSSTTVFIGYIPGQKNLAGKDFVTGMGMVKTEHGEQYGFVNYITSFESCKYECEINGGKVREFYIEQRTLSADEAGVRKLGEIEQVWRFNQGNGKSLSSEEARNLTLVQRILLALHQTNNKN